MATRLTMSVAMMMVVLMAVMKGERVSSQGSNACISSIIPCQQYINTTTKPPSECCTPLLNVINTDVVCLCNVLNSGILNSFNITLQQGLDLPRRCGQAVSTTQCSVAGAPSSTPTGNSPPPPPKESSSTINSAAAISISTLIAMTLVGFLLDGFH